MKKITGLIIRVSGKGNFDKLRKYCEDVGLGWFSKDYYSKEWECIRLSKTPKYADYKFYTKIGMPVIEFKDISNNGNIGYDKLNKLRMLYKLESDEL